MYKVCKFGGSSLSTAEEWKKVKAIVDSDDDRRIVVVSAVGKANKKDDKVTDLLYLIYQHHKYHVDYLSLFQKVQDKYLNIRNELGINVDLESDFEEIKERIDNDRISEEELVSRGEYLSAKMMAAYLGFDFVDSMELINFDYNGKIVEPETIECIERAVSVHEYMVVPGFYGSYPNYKICLFSRGGSDVTGSYLAKGSHADLYENFTDVSGFYMADPRIIENPRHISQISFDELRELSYMGASVLHEETILPLIDVDIPIIVLNTNCPEEPGTWVKKTVSGRKHLITGISGKKGFLALTFLKERSTDKLKLILKVLQVFESYHIQVENIPTSIDSFCVVVEKNAIEEKYYDLVADLKQIPGIIKIEEDEDIALLAVVGGNMVKKAGSSGQIMSVFGDHGINIKLIDQGLEEYNIILGVSNTDFDKSIRALYERFAHEKVNTEAN
jgi:aspartate kinase